MRDGLPKLKDFSKKFGDKANPNTSQAIANAIVHAMPWLKTASIDESSSRCRQNTRRLAKTRKRTSA